MQHDQLPRIVKDMMQVPRTLLAAETVRYEYQGAHREGGPRSSSMLQGPVWLELGSRDLEMAGAGCRAGLGKSNPRPACRTRTRPGPGGAPAQKLSVSKLLGARLPIFLLDPIASAPSDLGVSHHPFGTRSLDLLPDSAPGLGLYLLALLSSPTRLSAP